eukprot:TRINITY_DN5453_c0_g1_i1.p4 TRINITY_DN5453_c0_g1~~TRINITY_DN5453_c0_g1_i1.p4  ORF type:complete len:102 (-),score=8.38 TRINITY_DN5453_c0_g1_i1:282-587(-)
MNLRMVLRMVRDLFKEWKTFGMEEMEALKRQQKETQIALHRFEIMKQDRRQRLEQMILTEIQHAEKIAEQRLKLQQEFMGKDFQSLDENLQNQSMLNQSRV